MSSIEINIGESQVEIPSKIPGEIRAALLRLCGSLRLGSRHGGLDACAQEELKGQEDLARVDQQKIWNFGRKWIETVGFY